MNITRRTALIGLSAMVVPPARAQTNPPQRGAAEFAELEQPVVLDIAPTTGNLKETVQKGQQLIWRRKESPTDRVFQLSNISVGLLRTETGGQLSMTFSCSISSLGYMISDEAKLDIVARTRGGAAIYSWNLGIPVKCADRNQTLPPRTHEVPKDIAANLFTNITSVEITEYRESNSPEQKIYRCG